MAAMMGGGMMGGDAQDGAENDSSDAQRLDDLEARVSAIEQKLGMGAESSAPALPFGGKPKAAMGGKPGSPFYGG